KRRQGRLREEGSEGSLSHSHDPTNRNWIVGVERWVSRHKAAKPAFPRLARRKSGGCGAKEYVLIPGDLPLCPETFGTIVSAMGREGAAEVSRGHSTCGSPVAYWHLPPKRQRGRREGLNTQDTRHLRLVSAASCVRKAEVQENNWPSCG